MRKVLVTGGAGFIGSHICDALVQRGIEVVCIDNLMTGHRRNIEHLIGNAGFTFIEEDIRSKDACRKAMAGCDTVCHQAALGSVPRSVNDPITTNDHNINGTLNLLQTAVESGVKRFVYASSSSTYGDEATLPKEESRIGKQLSPYAVTKRVSELYAGVFTDIHGLECIGLRYFNIFGPRQDPEGMYAAVIPRFIDALRNGRPPEIHGDGQQSRDFTYVANAVQANIAAMTTENTESFGSVFNIAFGERTTINDLFLRIRELVAIDNPDVGSIVANHSEPRAGDVRHSLANISRAREIIGYTPEIDFNQGLVPTVESFM